MQALGVPGIRYGRKGMAVGADQRVAEHDIGLGDAGRPTLKIDLVEIGRGLSCAGGTRQRIAGAVEFLRGRQGTAVHGGLQLRFHDEEATEVQCDAHEPEEEQQDQSDGDDYRAALAVAGSVGFHDRLPECGWRFEKSLCFSHMSRRQGRCGRDRQHC
ncbi:hypothetical protein D3C86_1418850 [compost metagenome]